MPLKIIDMFRQIIVVLYGLEIPMMTHGDCNIEDVRDKVRRSIWKIHQLPGTESRSDQVTDRQVPYAPLPIAAPLRSWP